MRQGNIVSSLIIIALGVFMVIESQKMHSGFGGGLNPGVFPQLLGSALVLLAAIQLVMEFVPKLMSRDKIAWPEGVWRKRVIFIVGGIVAYLGLIEFIGFALDTFLLVVWAVHVLGSYKWHVNLGLGVLTAGLCTLVFQVWLEVKLPVVGWFGI